MQRHTLADWLAYIESLHPLGAAGIDIALDTINKTELQRADYKTINICVLSNAGISYGNAGAAPE